ncbi:TetR/AcrR family transcriptional regulator [Planococcus lenghuensis]|uniref:TetR family transcriptional regulator n=1 Tax=Planococcus lenghuensis TaxID=2213202 RepID=A0A1Q2KVT2_9BACL|nr:TetR/AcrR family transcriptional regulator [Planococcus lenghuensis]AQQ52226.1 TetR family transcriptional regulator [Planococcus lenghuensis]
MTSQSIKDAALVLFAEHGYNGTSLSQIAAETGLKKQSIYSHFESKDALFLQVLKDTFSAELHNRETYVNEQFDNPLDEFLLDAVRSTIDRFEHDSRLKFWLRVSFFPPAHLYEQTVKLVYSYIDQVDELYLKRFEQAVEQKEITRQDAKTATLAFSALIDSICVELVYGGAERTERKLEAAWAVYWAGI